MDGMTAMYEMIVYLVAATALNIIVIENFMQAYEESLYRDYIEVSRQGARQISEKLHAKGIKHEIFHRGKAGLMEKGQTDLAAAKGLESTRKTILRRQQKRLKRGKGLYAAPSEIFKDMHDLAGIRVAIYYPSDFEKVEHLIRNYFREISAPQDWPDRDYGPYAYAPLDHSESAKRDITGRHSRFPGYFSRHFRVQLRETAILPDDVKEEDDIGALDGSETSGDSWDKEDFWDNHEFWGKNHSWGEDLFKDWGDIKDKSDVKSVNDVEHEDNLEGKDDVRYNKDVEEEDDIEHRDNVKRGVDVEHRDDVKDRCDVKGKTLEIQVMSILMHSWSMINQELVYKPNASSGAVGHQRYQYGESGWMISLGPDVDEDDQRLLDIANGIVIAGEQVLRQLQTNLDTKMRRQQRPEGKIWKNVNFFRHIRNKWVIHGDMYGSNEPFMEALALGIQRQERMQSIIASWHNLGVVDDEMVDRYIEGAMQRFPIYFRGSDSVDIVLDHLFISTVRWRNFLTLEIQRRNVPESLMLVNKDDVRRFATKTEATQYVRYEALVVCNAMRFFVLNCDDYDDFRSKVDSWKPYKAYVWGMFGNLIHPNNTESFSHSALQNVHRVCNDLIHARTDYRWEAYCARGRLGIIHHVKAQRKFHAMCSICPAYFVRYLGGATSKRTVKHKTSYYKPVTEAPPDYSGWKLFESQNVRVKVLEEGLEKQHEKAVEEESKKRSNVTVIS